MRDSPKRRLKSARENDLKHAGCEYHVAQKSGLKTVNLLNTDLKYPLEREKINADPLRFLMPINRSG